MNDWTFAIKSPSAGVYGLQYTRCIGSNFVTIYKRRKDNLYHYHILNEKGKYTYRSESDPFFKGDVNPHNIIALVEMKTGVR